MPPECLDDYIAEDNTVRVVDAFAKELDVEVLGFARAAPTATGRPAYHPATLLKIYIYGYLNQVASSRRLERECQRNVELMWLTGRLAPDFKTIADFRRDNRQRWCMRRPSRPSRCRVAGRLCRHGWSENRRLGVAAWPAWPAGVLLDATDDEQGISALPVVLL